MAAAIQIFEDQQVNRSGISTLAYLIIRNNDDYLLEVLPSPESNEIFQPLRVDIQPGEYSWDAARRCVRSLFGCEIEEMTFLGPVEAIGQGLMSKSHEIAFVFEVSLPKQVQHRLSRLDVVELNGILCQWVSQRSLLQRKARMVPMAVWEML